MKRTQWNRLNSFTIRQIIRVLRQRELNPAAFRCQRPRSSSSDLNFKEITHLLKYNVATKLSLLTKLESVKSQRLSSLDVISI